MPISASTTFAATAIISAPFSLSSAVALHVYDNGVVVVEGTGDSLQRWSSFIGIVTAIIGNILISFALNIQRYAHIRLHKEREERIERSKNAAKAPINGYGTISNGNRPTNGTLAEEEANDNDPLTRSFISDDSQSTASPDYDRIQETSYLKSPYWWAGILLMMVGETGNFLAYGFAPASIVSPLGVVALISNCVIAPIMLKERFRWRDFWGVVVAVAGAVTVVLSAKHQERKLGPHEVIDAITSTAFEIYMAITISLIVALMWASPRYGSKTILIDLGLVGLFGGYTALSTKGVASMLSATLWKAFTTPITYALVAILIGTAIMQVKYVNKALQRFDSTQVIPVQFVMFTLSVIIGSAVLYRDFEQTTAERAAKFVGGCLLTFFGVFLITSGRSRYDDELDVGSDAEGEERIDLADQDENQAQYQDEADKYATLRPIQQVVSYGDNTFDEIDTPDQSRRSSRISFAPQSARPTTSQPPSIHLTMSNTSTGESSALLTNPWEGSSENLVSGSQTVHPNISPSPEVLPSGNPSRPHQPRSSTQGHIRQQSYLQQGPAPPQVDPDVARPYTPRHSISRSMIPGPFISPLSSSLSAVVADTLRRGVDAPSRRKSFRRPRLAIRSKSGDQDLIAEQFSSARNSPIVAGQRSVDESGNALGTSLDSHPEWTSRLRARSLSNAVGDFFSKKLKKESRDDGSGSHEV